MSVILRVIEKLRDCGAAPQLELEGILMTMFDARTNLSQQVAEDVRKHFGEKVYQTVIPRTVRLSEAPSFGKPIIAYDPHGAAATAYRNFACEVAQRSASQRAITQQAETPTVAISVSTTSTVEPVKVETPITQSNVIVETTTTAAHPAA